MPGNGKQEVGLITAATQLNGLDSELAQREVLELLHQAQGLLLRLSITKRTTKRQQQAKPPNATEKL